MCILVYMRVCMCEGVCVRIWCMCVLMYTPYTLCFLPSTYYTPTLHAPGNPHSTPNIFLYLYMFIYICLFVYVLYFIYVYLYMFICICFLFYICLFVYVYLYMFFILYMFIYICLFVYVFYFLFTIHYLYIIHPLPSILLIHTPTNHYHTQDLLQSHRRQTRHSR